MGRAEIEISLSIGVEDEKHSGTVVLDDMAGVSIRHADIEVAGSWTRYMRVICRDGASNAEREDDAEVAAVEFSGPKSRTPQVSSWFSDLGTQLRGAQ
jgi:hypothetical protein